MTEAETKERVQTAGHVGTFLFSSLMKLIPLKQTTFIIFLSLGFILQFSLISLPLEIKY